jgi:2-methylcitrate dehydratase PrpD
VTAPATRILAEFAVRMQTKRLAPEVQTKAAVCLLDALGLAVKGGTENTAAATRALFSENAQANTATVWADGAALSMLDAILCNGVAAHAHFQDDCDMTSWSHPGSMISPVALGLAEAHGASLDTALRGLVAGYAALNWLGAEEQIGRAVVARGLRASPTLGPVGAAVAGAVVLGLDVQQTASAIGIASDMAGGTLEPVRTGADDWRVQNGSAAWRGAVAALLARGGVVGSPTALEGDKGFARAFAGTEPPPGWATAPEEATILTVWEKAFPTLGDNIAVSLAACELSSRIDDPSSITEIVVHQNAEFSSYPGTSYRGPFERRAQAMASTAFAVATSLLRGEITAEVYDEALDDPAMLRLVDCLRVQPEPDYDYVDGRVHVRHAGGEISAASWDLPRTLLFRDLAAARETFLGIVSPDRRTEDVAALADTLLGDPTAAGTEDLRALLRRLSSATDSAS